MFTEDIHEALKVYNSNGLRSMPIHGVGFGCMHDRKELDRLRGFRIDPEAPDRHSTGLCFGKVPVKMTGLINQGFWRKILLKIAT